VLGFASNLFDKDLPLPKTLLIIALSLLLIEVTTAQEDGPEENPFVPQSAINQRYQGDQSFSIAAGAIIPLFTTLLHDIDISGKGSGATKTQLTVGGVGYLTYSLYAFPNIKLGLQLGGSFEWDINRNLLYMIPLVLRGTYEFRPLGRMTIPLHLGIGINMASWKEEFEVDFLLKPGFGLYFDWNVEWSFGVDFSYLFVPQLASKDKQYNAIANFMDITLVAEYHF